MRSIYTPSISICKFLKFALDTFIHNGSYKNLSRICMSTIFAPATAQGKAGVAVIRISGEKALDALRALCPTLSVIPRNAALAKLRHPVSGEVLDAALAIYFPSPHSFTGEDVVELHLHGSRAVLAEIMDILSGTPGFRLAEPGEFSKRSFLNGKMDLTEAEGLADLIDAETKAQHRLALRQMSGELHQLYDGWRNAIIEILAFVEAYIDFPDEDIPKDIIDSLMEKIHLLQKAIEHHLQDNRRGEKLRDGLYITIVGAPNVGKSSLLNYLAKRDVAIVSHIAGTTRDILEVQLNIAGYPVILADTAGLRETVETIEEEGIRRAKHRAGQADIILAMFDATKLDSPDNATLALVSETSLLVVNKIDSLPNLSGTLSLRGKTPIPISLNTGEGLETLLNALESLANEHMSPGNDPLITRARYREGLIQCLAYLKDFSLNKPIELASEDLRLAARELGKITGNIGVEDILDALFSHFCIGK